MTKNIKHASQTEAAGMDRSINTDINNLNGDMYNDMQQEEMLFLQLMEGYVMPNNFNTDLLEPQEVSEVEAQRILNRTMQNVQAEAGRQAKPRRGLPKRRLWVFGLAAVMLLAMSSLAVAEFAFKQDLLGFFNAEQLPQQSGQEINMQTSNENGTLTVEQVVGDRQSVYVLLDFVGPEGEALDKVSYSWEQAYVWLDKSNGCGYHFEDLPDDDPTDNHIRMLLCLNTDTSLKGQTLDLNLGGLRGYSVEDMDYTQRFEGEWKLSFKLDYTPISDVLPQDLDIQLGDATVHINSLEVSPFSMVVDVDVLNADGYVAPDWYEEPQGGGVEILEDGTERMFSYAESPVEVKIGDLLGDLDGFKVTLKDGTVLETNGGGANSDKGHHQCIFHFSQLVQLEDIASVSYLGMALKLQ